MRRKRSIKEETEKFSVSKSVDSIKRADLVVILIDASENIVDQDIHLLGLTLAIAGRFRPKLRYAHSGGKNPPRIIIHGNNLKQIQDSYTRYLENYFRNELELGSTPLEVVYKDQANPFKNKPNQLNERQLKKRKRMIKRRKKIE